MLDNLRKALQDTSRWKLVNSSTIKDLKAGVAYLYISLGIPKLGFDTTYRFIYQDELIHEVDDEFTVLVFRLKEEERNKTLKDLDRKFNTGDVDGK